VGTLILAYTTRTYATQHNKTKQRTGAAYYFHLAGKYLRWSNMNYYHRLWWVQHILTKSFWFFVNIKIIAKKTTAPSFVTSWITLRKISL